MHHSFQSRKNWSNNAAETHYTYSNNKMPGTNISFVLGYQFSVLSFMLI